MGSIPDFLVLILVKCLLLSVRELGTTLKRGNFLYKKQ